MTSTLAAAGLPALPSLFEPVALREGADALARAVALAPSRGAGTLCWVRSAARLEAAVVLEPEAPLRIARAVRLAALAAAADALGAHGPPDRPLTLRWPGTLRFDGADLGEVRLAAPPGCAEEAVPDWLVVGLEARLSLPPGAEPGRDPGRTSLEEEGFETLDPATLTAAWARHLMATLAEWGERGAALLAERVLSRLEAGPGEAGWRRGLDPETGDLVLERGGERRRLPLAPP